MRRDFLRAAVFLCMMPFCAALVERLDRQVQLIALSLSRESVLGMSTEFGTRRTIAGVALLCLAVALDLALDVGHEENLI